MTKYKRIIEADTVQAFFSTGKKSLRLPVLRESGVLSIPSADERTALVVLLTTMSLIHRGRSAPSHSQQRAKM